MDFSNESRNLQIANCLQALRLEQNLTLEELSSLSQVPVTHLKSIEEGNFLKFDKFYLKIYLKRYTQSLDVSLEKLYAYNEQQAATNLSASEATSKQQAPKTQKTVTKAPKKIASSNASPVITTSKTSQPAYLKSKKMNKVLISLLLLFILTVFVFFIVIIIRDLRRYEPSQDDPPTLPSIVVPDEINLGNSEDEDAGDDDDEIDDEAGLNEEVVADTTVEFVEHFGETQSFAITTSRDEIVLRIEFAGDSWIGGTIGHTDLNTVVSGVFEEVVELTDDAIFNFRLGAVHEVSYMTINGEAVDFIEGIVGAQNFIFDVNRAR